MFIYIYIYNAIKKLNETIQKKKKKRKEKEKLDKYFKTL